MGRKRHITLDVYDYSRSKLCCLYDSKSNAKGQAYDIVRTTELTGWKEVSFCLPFLLEKKRNFRWNFIRSEYYLRVTVDGKSDWYIIHSPKKTKNSKAITNTVSCSHISSALKTKNLYLTFDDETGIGTVQYLVERALSGTGWTLDYYDTMLERDGVTEKIRTLKSEGKAGTYKLITDICTLFSCYPVFDGEKKTVSLYALKRRGTLREMTIGKDIETLSVEFNSEDIITRLYVEGEYGDYGYVGIDDVNPTGLSYLLNFDYYKSIGLFTDAHQAALDTYLEGAKAANADLVALTAKMNEKENALNELWGQVDCAIYTVTDGTLSETYIARGNVTDEKAAISEGDTVTILQGDGKYREQVAGENGATMLLDTDIYAIKFITLPSGQLGAKQVAIEAKVEMIESLNNRIKDYTTENRKQSILDEIAALQGQIEELYAPADGSKGAYAMMSESVALSVELDEMEEEWQKLLLAQASVESTFYETMGDLLKDGYWNDSNYTVGQEAFLYADALDVMEHMSKPEVKYTVNRVSLAGQLGYESDDLDLNMNVRVYDEDLGVNDILYITKLTQYLDKEQADTVELSNEDISLSGLDMGSILSRMTSLADLINEKNALYERAKAISKDNTIYVDRLNGQIDVLKHQISSSVSSWYTDANGNIVFESSTGKSAMMLTGDGFMLANGKNEDGSWNWRTKHHWFAPQ